MTKKLTLKELEKRITSLSYSISNLEHNALDSSKFKVGDKVYTHTRFINPCFTRGYRMHYVITKKEFKTINETRESIFGRIYNARTREGIIYTVVNTDTGSTEEKHEDDLHKKGWF